MRETSLEAFESIRKRILPLIMEIEILIKKKKGLTCYEIERMLNLSHQTASARITELIKDGKVSDSGLRRPTNTGRNAIVWH